MNLRVLSCCTFLAVAGLPALQAGPGLPVPEHGCARPAPAPVFTPQAAVTAHVFKKVSDHEATESAVLNGTMNVAISQWGCQDLMLTFSLESKTLPDLTKDVPAGYREAAAEIRHLAALKARTGFNLEKAAAVLDAEARKKAKGLTYIHPLHIPGSAKDLITVQGFTSGKAGTRLTFEFMRILPRKKQAKKPSAKQPARHASK